MTSHIHACATAGSSSSDRYIQVGAALVALLLASRADAGPVSSFEDIDYWVGAGSNRAAVAIDWDKNSAATPALVWGFRWDGVATGQTMLNAIVAADPRLFAKSSGHGSLGSAVYGLGYDDGDGEFALDRTLAADGGACNSAEHRQLTNVGQCIRNWSLKQPVGRTGYRSSGESSIEASQRSKEPVSLSVHQT